MLASLITTRNLNFVGAIACTSAMLIALFMQYAMSLEPCKLCYLQRGVVIMLGVTFLVAALHNPATVGRRIYAGLCFLITIAGNATAIRHIWLQNLPEDRVPACGPSIDYLLEVFTFTETIKSLWQGAGDCAEVSWSFLGLTIPEQLLLFFLVMTALAIYQLIRKS